METAARRRLFGCGFPQWVSPDLRPFDKLAFARKAIIDAAEQNFKRRRQKVDTKSFFDQRSKIEARVQRGMLSN